MLTEEEVIKKHIKIGKEHLEWLKENKVITKKSIALWEMELKKFYKGNEK